MRIIKRYSNRKLYDTEAKAYINLAGIATLIRQGKEVQVIDNTSGEDITSLILSQIISKQEKDSLGYLPRSILTTLVQAGEQGLRNLRQSIETRSDLIRQIDEEIEQRLEVLVQQGEMAESAARSLRDQLLTWSRETRYILWGDDAKLNESLAGKASKTRVEIKKLTEQVEILSKKLDEYRNQQKKN
jgi:polyhydroxyalkanoate synthesis repressor PhaR